MLVLFISMSIVFMVLAVSICVVAFKLLTPSGGSTDVRPRAPIPGRPDDEGVTASAESKGDDSSGPEATESPDNNIQTIEFDILGHKFHLRGGTAFAVLASGVILAALLLVVVSSLFAKQLDALKEQNQRVKQELSEKTIDPSVLPAAQSGKVTTKESLEEPVKTGFRTIEEVRIYDLRTRVPIPPDRKGERVSPITTILATTLEKIGRSLPYLDFEFGTAGVDIEARSLTQDYELLKSSKPHYHGDNLINTAAIVRVDVKHVKQGENVIVVNEATYWNGFAGEQEEWAATVALGQTDSIMLIVIAPESKKMNNLRFYEYEHKSRVRTPYEGAKYYLGNDGTTIKWRIDGPKPDYAYEVRWNW